MRQTKLYPVVMAGGVAPVADCGRFLACFIQNSFCA